MKDWNNIEADVDMILDKHFTYGRNGYSIDYIVVHHNAGNLTVEDCYNVWQTRAASAHYQVESSGRIGQLVWDSNTAWHASNGIANNRSIGIEHANNNFGPWTISEECLENGAHLVAALCKYYNLGRPEWLVNVYPHSYFAATACPGEIAGSQNAHYMERAQAWYDEMVNPTPVTPLPDSLKGFSDLDPDAWYIPYLDKMVTAGYMNGYPDGTMHPDSPITRGEFVCLLGKIEGLEYDDPFTDVTASPFYYHAVEWAKEQGIATGNAGEFRPEDACTREEAMTMLARWKNGASETQHTEFADWTSVDDWAKPSVAWCIEKEIVSGNDGYIRPFDPCTRAEAASMLSKELGL